MDVVPVHPGHTFARRRRKRDERLRPTQRAVSPAGDGASYSPRSRRRLLSPRDGFNRPHTSSAGTLCAMSSNGDGGLSLHEAAQRAGVSAATLRRWVRGGLIPQYDGTWSPAAVGHARLVARLRDRGHSLAGHPQLRRRTAGSRSATSRSCSRTTAGSTRSRQAARGDRTGAGADRADRHHARLEPDAGRDAVRGRDPAAALRLGGARRRAAARRDAPARARLRTGDGPGGRRRGAAVSPLRPRAADALGVRRPRRWPRRCRR